MTEFDKVIPPGGVGKVKASVNTEHFRGPVSKSVTVTTNDPAHRTTILTLKADVLVPIDVQPSENLLIQGKLGTVKPVEATLTSVDGTVFDILKVEANPPLRLSVRAAPAGEGNPAAAAVAEPAGKKKGKERSHNPQTGPGTGAAPATAPVAAGASRYVLTVAPEEPIEVGRKFSTVTVTTSHPKAPSLPIRVNLFVQGALEVLPERLFFSPPVAGQTAPRAQMFRIRKPDGEPLKIEGVESRDPDFKAVLKSITEGREYEVTVEYAGKPGRGWVSTDVTVRTNEPTQRSVIVPISGRL